MCGIVGYIGQNEAAPVLILSLIHIFYSGCYCLCGADSGVRCEIILVGGTMIWRNLSAI